MSKRANALAERFETANAELIEVVEAIPENKWRALCRDEQWTVGVVAHHVAFDHAILADVTNGIVAGEAPALTWEMLDDVNAKHLQEHRDCGKEETLALLRSGGAKVSETLRSLSDEDLERTTIQPFIGEQPITAADFIEAAVIGHIGMHLPSIRSTVASSAQVATSG